VTASRSRQISSAAGDGLDAEGDRAKATMALFWM